MTWHLHDSTGIHELTLSFNDAPILFVEVSQQGDRWSWAVFPRASSKPLATSTEPSIQRAKRIAAYEACRIVEALGAQAMDGLEETL